MNVKICGITNQNEIKFLNKYQPEYVGFVVYEKSKRYVKVEKAKDLMSQLDTAIKRVAVTVNPDIELIKEINTAGFDIIQIHKGLTNEMLEASKIEVWYAVNIADEQKLKSSLEILDGLKDRCLSKVTAIVVDGAEYGSGKTFDWNKIYPDELKRLADGRKLILAGGLNRDNIKTGINIFKPDTVDVSSGVEGQNGKDEDLVREFIERAKEDE